MNEEDVHYPPPEAASKAAVIQMMDNDDDSELTQEDIEAIKESDAQFERGEFIDFDTFAVQMREKYCMCNGAEIIASPISTKKRSAARRG